MRREYPEYDGGEYETCQVCKHLTPCHYMYNQIITDGAHRRVCDSCLPDEPPQKEDDHMTSKEEISRWFDNGRAIKSTHLIVMCDDFDREDYPIYFTGTPDEAKEKVNKLNGQDMQRCMEVYNLSADKERQLMQTRSHNYSPSDVPAWSPPESLIALKLTPHQVEVILKMLRDCRRSDYKPSTLNEVDTLIKMLKGVT